MLRAPASSWTSMNSTLERGAIGYESDTGFFKRGDGVTPWSLLAYGSGAATDPVQPAASGQTFLSGPPGPKGDQGPQGAPGADGALEGAASVSFSYGDATPRLIASVTVGRRIALARIDMYVPFNGDGPALSIGTLAVPDALMSSTLNDPAMVSGFESMPMQALADADIYLFITPGSGASTGAGHVLIRAQP